MCVAEQLRTNRGMIYKDTLKNQQLQVRKFKHMLRRQGDKHPAFISSKLQIFLLVSFFLSFQITLKVHFSKQCEKENHGPSESGQDVLMSAGSASDKKILRDTPKMLGTGATKACRF